MAPFNQPFTIPPILNHTHTLILLHDRGGSGQQFGLDILGATDSSGKFLQTMFPSTKFIFPSANAQCVTGIPGGPRMPQWFDNYSTKDPSEREALQFKGLREGCHHVHFLIDQESEAIPLENIFLGGFSQGSAIALYALLTYRSETREGNLGGFVGLSVWLPLRTSLDGLIEFYADETQDDREEYDVNVQVSTLLRNQIGLPPSNASLPLYAQIPIFLGHGLSDAEVSVELARDAAKALTRLGLDVTLKKYAGLGHVWRNGDELDDIASFLGACGVK